MQSAENDLKRYCVPIDSLREDCGSANTIDVYLAVRVDYRLQAARTPVTSKERLGSAMLVIETLLVNQPDQKTRQALGLALDCMRTQSRAVETSVTTGDSNAKQASLAGNSADASNVEPGNISGAGRDVSARGDQQQAASYAERMFRSHPKASDLADLIRSRLFQTFLGQGFWHAHHVDLIWRYNGHDVREEADWLKDVWYVMRGAVKKSSRHDDTCPSLRSIGPGPCNCGADPRPAEPT